MIPPLKVSLHIDPKTQSPNIQILVLFHTNNQMAWKA